MVRRSTSAPPCVPGADRRRPDGHPAGRGIERTERRVQAVDLAFQALHLDRLHAQHALLVRIVARPAEVGAEIEQVVLDARKHGVRDGFGVQPGEADHGVGLVDRAETATRRSCLYRTGAVAQRSLATGRRRGCRSWSA